MKPSQTSFIALLFLCALGAALLSQLSLSSAPNIEIGGYATSLQARTSGQKRNALLSARALDGRLIKPGATFSFNAAVRSWTHDQGYVKAPVSFDGELMRAYGGGVCQTSTTLYNAVLLAGLPIVERHPHIFHPQYIAPGRDAAVAYPGVDLRFRNPHSWPIRISARADGDTLQIRLLGAEKSPPVRIETQQLSRTDPARLTRVSRGDKSIPAGGAGRVYLRSPGASGFRVATFRVFTKSGTDARREHLSDDTYPVLNRVVALTEGATE